jgi:hypothetical protein
MGKLAAWAEAGADDAMLARSEKAIFGLLLYIIIDISVRAASSYIIIIYIERENRDSLCIIQYIISIIYLPNKNKPKSPKNQQCSKR